VHRPKKKLALNFAVKRRVGAGAEGFGKWHVVVDAMPKKWRAPIYVVNKIRQFS